MPHTTCIVPACPTSKKGYDGPFVSTFNCPKLSRNEWEKSIPVVKSTFPQVIRVCERHFEPELVLRYGTCKDENGNDIWYKLSSVQLKPGAVPTIFPEHSKSMQGHAPAPRECSEVKQAKRLCTENSATTSLNEQTDRSDNVVTYKDFLANIEQWYASLPAEVRNIWSITVKNDVVHLFQLDLAMQPPTVIRSVEAKKNLTPTDTERDVGLGLSQMDSRGSLAGSARIPSGKVGQPKRIAIIGGGLVGALNACFFAKKGFLVDVYEYRADIRSTEKAVGRSINLALSFRGRTALKAVGLEEHVVSEGIPMRARMIHDTDESTHEVPYGIFPDQFIISIDRRRLNEVMLSLAEKYTELVTLHFHHKLIKVDLHSGSMKFVTEDGSTVERSADLIVGCDGAYSAVRQAMMKQSLFDYSQEFIEHGYIELETPPNTAGEYAMPPNYLHIWPRDTFMLIALPNLDRSFTTTLFMPFRQFEELKTEPEVLAFFQDKFPDALKIIGESNLVQSFLSTKPSSLISIKCKPYHVGRTVILGDAAHAMVPFYGQGMNAGFLDCLVFHDLMESLNDDIDLVLPAFTELMLPNSHAIIDLAMYNYIEMRHLVNTWNYYLRKKVDDALYRHFPGTWVPLYTMVTFSMTPYAECVENRAWQDKVLRRAKWVLGISTLAVGLYWFFPRPTVNDYLVGFKEAVNTWWRNVKIEKFYVTEEDSFGTVGTLY